ncbi:MAG: UDP-glucose 4-epimerase GalE [Alphaproteobacteria bacterium]|nr:UDP-glucose 4-epimerase GalE [Alphaproteobacteria bacterium]
MSILVTGGAGYIGSHMAHRLVDLGETVIVLDNLSTGVRQNVPQSARLVEGDIADAQLVAGLVQENKIDAVIHFAGSVVVPESVALPLDYYANNTASARTLIEVCVRNQVPNFLFSSTAAVYGIPERIPAREDDATVPVSPYGRSKLMTEWILRDAADAHGIRFGILRYFNVAGADPAGRTGQSTPRATHLIKRACQVATGKADNLTIYGDDYETPDGTGVRDYIHVSDLVDIHEKVLVHLRKTGESILLNCGYGRGFSVREVASTVERVSGRTLPVEIADRRPGDLPSVVADTSRLTNILGWTPKYADLDTIVSTALAWENKIKA